MKSIAKLTYATVPLVLIPSVATACDGDIDLDDLYPSAEKSFDAAVEAFNDKLRACVMQIDHLRSTTPRLLRNPGLYLTINKMDSL